VRGTYIERDSLLVEHLHKAVAHPRGGFRTASLVWDAYRPAYYGRNFHCSQKPREVDRCAAEAALAYWRGVEFTVRYYLHGIPDWQWQYPYHYAPLACDLAAGDVYLALPAASRTSPETAPIVPGRAPVHRHVALLSILPADSLQWLPFRFDPISAAAAGEGGEGGDKGDKGDACRSWFDCEAVTIDLEGKKNDYEGVVLLPSVDLGELEAFLRFTTDLPAGKPVDLLCKMRPSGAYSQYLAYIEADGESDDKWRHGDFLAVPATQ